MLRGLKKKAVPKKCFNSQHFILGAWSFIIIVLSVSYSSEAQALSDETIKQQIEAKAADTLELKDTQVRVDVEDRLVVLSGTVRLYEQKMTYEKIAWLTMDVAEVENEIRVAPMYPLNDRAINRKIREIIKAHRRLHGAQLTVTVKGGAVVLQGAFEHPRDVLFLKHKVAGIEGVIAIEIQARFNV